MAVRVIKAKPVVQNGMGSVREVMKLRVAAYCRVSTDQEEQESSYEAQCTHYEGFIKGNPEWEFAGIYADEGITGTSTKKRDDFNRMIRACEAHEIDMVITKSISRFARNTLDCLQNIRKLKALGIAVLFEKEAINTLDAKGEVLITIMASIAQQESQSISQNVRMGIQYRFQQGKPMINHKRFLGYDKDENGKLVINAEQAAIVRRIYRNYIEGLSPEFIACRLREEGVKSGAGTTSWAVSTVRYILQNEKYIGDLLLQKTLVADFLTHKMVRNKGELPQYYVENSHEPIIPRDVFRLAQGETLRRHVLKEEGIVLRYGSKSALCGRLLCEKCGAAYKRFPRKYTEWRCGSRVAGECDGDTVKEAEVQRVVLNAMNLLPTEKENIIRVQERARARMEALDEKIEVLNDAIAELEAQMQGNSQMVLPECMEDDAPAFGADSQLQSRMDELHAQKQRLQIERSEHAALDVQVTVTLELIDAIEGRPYARRFYGDRTTLACYDYDDFFDRTRPQLVAGALREYDDEQVIRYLKSVVVCEDRYQVNFKAGVTIEMRR